MEVLIWIDYLIIAVIAVSALIGLARGLIREVIALAIWGVALFVAYRYHAEAMTYLEPYIELKSARQITAFAGVGVAVLFVGAIVAHLLSLLVDKSGLGGLDAVLGFLFGAARGALLIAALVFLAAMTPVAQESWWDESPLIARFQTLADRVLAEIPPDLVEKVKAI